jgi:hypothetical protein
MTIQETYVRFLQLVNRNATNNNVNVDLYRFVKMFNDLQNRYVEWVLDKRNDDSIRDVQKLLVVEQPLPPEGSTASTVTFTLPSDFFDFANISAVASSECCEKERVLVYEVKSEDAEEIYNDKYSEPSFEWRETFGYLSENRFVTFVKDFSIEELLLTYYRKPLQVDIAGYPRLDGTPSVSIDPEFEDAIVNRILLAMAKEFSAINENPQSYQLDKDRLFNI